MRGQRRGIVLAAAEDEVADLGREARRGLEQQHVMGLDTAGMVQERRLERRARGEAAEACEGGEIVRLERQALRLLVATHLQAMLAPSISTVRRPRSAGRRPPNTSCCVWTKNSISRMPPRPSLMSWPATAMASCPRTTWIWRFIAWMSAMVAKSKYLRQMNDVSSARKRAPASRSPAIGRALMKAARSQFWPRVS